MDGLPGQSGVRSREGLRQEFVQLQELRLARRRRLLVGDRPEAHRGREPLRRRLRVDRGGCERWHRWLARALAPRVDGYGGGERHGAEQQEQGDATHQRTPDHSGGGFH